MGIVGIVGIVGIDWILNRKLVSLVHFKEKFLHILNVRLKSFSGLWSAICNQFSSYEYLKYFSFEVLNDEK